ncbi:hypothetical protein ABZS29_23205 [Kribbella sp. NPDC005582]|uniref:hypothetical protein n=1 Tax=Kribbella sp. NPDC005582 TaxID=3156893 RepID=UPI00339FE97B
MVMGELSPADWTAELERSGRVVFPLRKRPNVRRIGLTLPFSFAGVVFPLLALRDAEGTPRLMLLLVLGFSIMSIVCFVWAARSRQPHLIVTPNTLHVGKRPVAWPADVRLLNSYVTDPAVLESWLNERRPTPSVS